MAALTSLIQFKRRIPGTGVPPNLAAGEPATTITAAGVADLYIGDGSAVRTLVSDTRQVELTGAQTITGAKTIAVGSLHITGGAADDILSTDGAGGLSWIVPPSGGVSVGGTAPTPAVAGDLWFNTTTQQLMAYSGSAWVIANGVRIAATAPPGVPTGTAWLNSTTHVLSIWNGTAWVESTGSRSYTGPTAPTGTHSDGDIWWSPSGPQFWNGTAWTVATLPSFAGVEVQDPLDGVGTSADPLTVTPATTAQIGTGTDNVFPITSAGLRTQLGANVTALTTTAQTIVPAINELVGEIAGVSGAVRFIGTYDVPGDEMSTGAGSPATDGDPLPAAAAANEGWYFIVTDAGAGIGNAPDAEMEVGDWIVSTGTAWVHVSLHSPAITAANVGITTIDTQPWGDVQEALEGLFTHFSTAGNAAVLADGVSVLGDGTSAAETATAGALRVGTVDGGVF